MSLRFSRIAFALATALGCIISCTTTPPGGMPVAEPESNAGRMAIADHVAEMAEQFQRDDGQLDIPAIVDAMSKMPEFVETGMNDGGAFGRFANGELLVVIANRLADEDDQSDWVDRSEPKEDPTERIKPYAARLPTNSKVYLMNAMGNAFTNLVPTLEGWLKAAGYRNVVNLNPSVENLINLRDVSLLYFNTHGIRINGNHLPNQPLRVVTDPDIGDPPPAQAFVSNTDDHFAFWTTTKLTDDSVNTHRARLMDGRLVYAVAQVDRTNTAGKLTIERHLAITELFIQDAVDGWTFKRNGGFVYMDACSSVDTRARDACLAAGADYYVGWTEPTNNGSSAASARFLFDRLLGGNRIDPIRTPHQRPFNLDDVMSAMAQVKRPNGQPYDTSVDFVFFFFPDQKTESKLVARKRAGAPPGLLRPGLTSLGLDERNNQLSMVGDFGDRAGKIFVNGQSRSANGGWNRTTLKCTINPDDTGPVYVEVDGRKSNVRYLSAWDMMVKHSFVSALPSVCSNCRWNMTWKFRLRMDMMPSRYEIEKAVTPRGYASSGVRGATFTLDSVTGMGMVGGDTFTHSKRDTSPEFYPSGQVSLGAGEWFSVDGIVKVGANQMLVATHVDTDGYHIDWSNGDSGDGHITRFGVADNPTYPSTMTVPMDGNFKLSHGTKVSDVNGSLWEWFDANIISPPPSNLPV